MSQRKEKLVLLFLCKTCSGTKTSLISPHDIAKSTAKKVVLSASEIDEIMTSLSLQNYIDFVVSDGKDGYFYCVKLKNKGRMFVEENKRARKTLVMLMLRSAFLAVISFFVGLILKAIFN